MEAWLDCAGLVGALRVTSPPDRFPVPWKPNPTPDYSAVRGPARPESSILSAASTTPSRCGCGGSSLRSMPSTRGTRPFRSTCFMFASFRSTNRPKRRSDRRCKPLRMPFTAPDGMASSGASGDSTRAGSGDETDEDEDEGALGLAPPPSSLSADDDPDGGTWSPRLLPERALLLLPLPAPRFAAAATDEIRCRSAYASSARMALRTRSSDSACCKTTRRASNAPSSLAISPRLVPLPFPSPPRPLRDCESR